MSTMAWDSRARSLHLRRSLALLCQQTVDLDKFPIMSLSFVKPLISLVCYISCYSRSCHGRGTRIENAGHKIQSIRDLVWIFRRSGRCGRSRFSSARSGDRKSASAESDRGVFPQVCVGFIGLDRFAHGFIRPPGAFGHRLGYPFGGFVPKLVQPLADLLDPVPPVLRQPPHVQPVDRGIDAVAVEVLGAALRTHGVQRGEAPRVGVVIAPDEVTVETLKAGIMERNRYSSTQDMRGRNQEPSKKRAEWRGAPTTVFAWGLYEMRMHRLYMPRGEASPPSSRQFLSCRSRESNMAET